MVKDGHPTVVVNVTAEAHCAPGGCPSNLRANGAGRVGKQHPTDHPQRLRSWDIHSRKYRNRNVTSGIFLILYPPFNLGSRRSEILTDFFDSKSPATQNGNFLQSLHKVGHLNSSKRQMFFSSKFAYISLVSQKILNLANILFPVYFYQK